MGTPLEQVTGLIPVAIAGRIVTGIASGGRERIVIRKVKEKKEKKKKQKKTNTGLSKKTIKKLGL